MSQHLSSAHLQRFRDRTADAKELVRIDRHLAECAECREQLAAPDGSQAFLAKLQVAGEETHLTYEELEAYVQSQVDDIDREIVTSHTEMCSQCADRLQSLQRFAELMASPVPAMPVAAA